MNTYPVDVNKDRLFTLKELGDLFGLGIRAMQIRKKDGDVPKSIQMYGKELYPAPFVNEYITTKNPQLIERMASASDINSAAMNAIQGEG